MNEQTQHPGTVLFDDQVDGRQWEKAVDELPETIAWVTVAMSRQPVAKIVITGTVEQRRITKLGVDGQKLETTIQQPPRRPAPPPAIVPQLLPQILPQKSEPE